MPMQPFTEDVIIQYVKDELQAGIVNLELDEAIIRRNLKRALMVSSDYFNYTSYKTLSVNNTTGSSGFIELSEIDPDGIPTITQVWPTVNVMNIDAALLGLGSIYVNMGMSLNPQLMAYSSMLNKLTQLEGILGRNARVVGDKLYLDHYWTDVTIEYIPQVSKVENIHEGSWIRFLIDYTTALSKRQIAQSRGKYVVSSNPATTNAAELLSQANERIVALEEEIKSRGVLLARRFN
jgi:hypothetical protein